MPPMKLLTLEVSSFPLTSDQTSLYLLEEMLLDFHRSVPLLGLPAHSDRSILCLRLRRKLRSQAGTQGKAGLHGTNSANTRSLSVAQRLSELDSAESNRKIEEMCNGWHVKNL